ncbi:MAG: hypothetical protein IKB71_02535 [Lentisphaeria bacterium]|nr:hypothetical protein [Lentisphaeria bacterium]
MTKIHFIGIGGIGMSGLASMYHAQGYEVSGSDRGAERPENQCILSPLKKQGIRIYPQDGSFFAAEQSDIVVYSSAIESDNPDFKVLPEGVQKMHRSEALQKIILESSFKNTIAVSGSCGKSSVTAYLAETLLNCGVDVDCLNGAIVKRFQAEDNVGNFRKGNGEVFVFEADESDKSLLCYTPDYAVVLNMGTDHYSREELAEVFGTFVNNAGRGAVVARSVYEEILPFLSFPQKVTVFEDGELQNGLFLSDYEVCEVAVSDEKTKPSKLGDESILKAYGLFHDQSIMSRELHVQFNGIYNLTMPVWGKHNALNALAIFGMLRLMDFKVDEILHGLAKFSGVFRRFDFAGISSQGAYIFDDYAHNPEKLISCLKSARERSSNNIYMIFQPHGYGPLGFMRDELGIQLEKNLKSNEFFLMTEPFYAGGTTSFKPSSAEVVEKWQHLYKKADHFVYAPDREFVTAYLYEHLEVGDVVLICGARDNSLAGFAAELAGK